MNDSSKKGLERLFTPRRKNREKTKPEVSVNEGDAPNADQGVEKSQESAGVVPSDDRGVDYGPEGKPADEGVTDNTTADTSDVSSQDGVSSEGESPETSTSHDDVSSEPAHGEVDDADQVKFKESDIDELFARHNPGSKTPIKATYVTHKVVTDEADNQEVANERTMGRKIWYYTMIACGVIIVLAIGHLILSLILPHFGPDIDDTTTVVKRADIPIVVISDAKVSGAVTEPIFSPSAGTLRNVKVKDGDTVKFGQQIGTVTFRDEAATNAALAKAKKEAEEAAENSDDEDAPDEIVVEVKPVYRTVNVTAPIDGKLKLTAKNGDYVDTTKGLGEVRANKQIVSGTLTPDEKNLLGSLPSTGSIDVKGQEQTCAGLHFTEGSDLDYECELSFSDKPFDVRKAALTMRGEDVHDVLVIPLTSVERIGDFGTVYVLDDPSDPDSGMIANVKVGVDNGKIIEVTDGLHEGQRVVTENPDIPKDKRQEIKDKARQQEQKLRELRQQEKAAKEQKSTDKKPDKHKTQSNEPVKKEPIEPNEPSR